MVYLDATRRPVPDARRKPAARWLSWSAAGLVSDESEEMMAARTLDNISIYRLAKALNTRYGFDPDIAFLAAWRWKFGRLPAPTLNVAMAQMSRVRSVPYLDEAQIETLLEAYSRYRRPPTKLYESEGR